MENITVSVMMITYNHGRFLAQALDSILAQKVDFEIEIVIGEDCSTDNTREILLDYQSRHPTIIRALLPSHNIGAMNNQIQVMEACKGRFVAILEGDDYWIDQYKLQRQVAYLEAHPTTALVFTDCALVDERGQILEDNLVPPRRRHNFTLRSLLRDFCLPTLTVLYRNVVFTIPSALRHVISGDFVLFALIGQYGSLDYMPGCTAHYRMHKGGVWSSQSKEQQFHNNLRTSLAILNYLGKEYTSELMPAINYYYTQLGSLLWHQPSRRTEFWRIYFEFSMFSLRTFNKELPAFTLRLLKESLTPN